MYRLSLAALIALSIASTAIAQTAATSPCTYSPDHLSSVLGKPFRAGVPEAGLLGKGCTYAAGDIKLWVDAGPNPAPSAQMYRKMSNPPGTTLTPVANDPDKAVQVTPPPGVSPYPSLSYERQGWLVNITVTGVSGKAAIDAWNAKLLQLKRFP